MYGNSIYLIEFVHSCETWTIRSDLLIRERTHFTEWANFFFSFVSVEAWIRIRNCVWLTLYGQNSMKRKKKCFFFVDWFCTCRLLHMFQNCLIENALHNGELRVLSVLIWWIVCFCSLLFYFIFSVSPHSIANIKNIAQYFVQA